MIHLYVIKSTCGEAVKWDLCPEKICIGAQDSNQVEQLQVELPEEWKEFTVRITFLPFRKDPIAVILQPDTIIDITGDITGSNRGKIVLDAIKGEQITFSAGADYYAYQHPEAGGKDPGYTPDEYQQFVQQIEEAARQAAEGAERSETAADKAEEAAIRQPVIGENGNWEIWDPETGEYKDSGFPASGGGGGGYKIGDGLKLENGVLSVDTAAEVQQDNTKPVTSAAVYTQLGNVEALLASI
ncbi:MAG: hypothetical protein ACOX6P_11520 [Candidatus Merdivicinus sp.]|jgi:hypothetical protein